MNIVILNFMLYLSFSILLVSNSIMSTSSDLNFSSHHRIGYDMSVEVAGNSIKHIISKSRYLEELNYMIFSTVIGSGITGYNGDNIDPITASLDYPVSVAISTSGNILVADTISNRIRFLSKLSGKITTIAGTGSTGYNGDGIDASLAKIWAPQGVCVMSNSNIVIADTNNVRVRMINIVNGKISTIAGTGSAVGTLTS